MPAARHTPPARYERGLSTSVVNNASAFGFSVMITAGYGMLSHFHSNPSALNVFLFAIAAAVAVGVIEGVVSRGFRVRAEPHPEEVIMLGTAANVISVAISLAVFYGAGATIPDMVVWPVAPLLGSAAYVLVEGAELAVAEAFQDRVRRDPAAESKQ
jgi:hypothetical protein